MKDDITIHSSSNNVFKDLGVADPEEYLAKSEMAALIQELIQGRNMKQSEAAQLLGINQPKVSALLNGHLDGFSTDRLFRFINRLGCDIEIKISSPHHSPGHLSVMTALAG